MKEQILDTILRKMRIRRVLPTILRYPHCALLDIGCGWEAKLLHAVEPYISKGIGIDFKAPKIHEGKLSTMPVTLEKTLPFESESFNVVTMLAVLEHLEHPIEICQEIYRVLKQDGSLVLTVPSVWSQPVLEILSFKIGIISKEISDHKLYYNRLSLEFLSRRCGLKIVEHKYFQLWMNNFCVLSKIL